MAIATSIITATRSGTPSTLIVNRGPKGADGADGADGISELGSAATTGFSAGQIPRIKTAGGVEGRTPAQVLSDIGGAASSHAHGSITSAGAIGTTANLPVITGAAGALAAGSFGTWANSFCQGNDSRLSDTRTPKAHAHPYVDMRPASDEFMVSSSAYFDAGNNLTLSSLDSHRLKIGNDDMPSYTEVLILPDASSMEGKVVIVWNTRSATQTVKNADEITLGTIGAGNCALLSCDGETWTFTTMSQRMLLTLAEISPLPVANGGTGAATAPLARAALGITEYGDPVVTATSKGAAQTAIGIVNMTPAAYTALVVAGTVDATTLYLLTE